MDKDLQKMVSAAEIAGSVSRSEKWAERQGAAGEFSALRQRSGYIIDPRGDQNWLRSQGDKSADSVSVELATLRAVSLAFLSGEAPESVCRRILNQIAENFGATSGAIFVSNEAGDFDLIATVGRGTSETLSGVGAWVSRIGEPMLLSDPRRSNLAAGTDASQRSNDVLGTPFRIDGQVMGVMVLIRGLDAGPFADRDVAMATVVATELALAIERVHIQERLQRRIQEADLAQRQLESFAFDVRQTYAAERERAAQLADALSELEHTYLATVRGMAVAVEAKDAYTAGHIARVTRYGLMIMRAIAPERASDPQFEYGFLLHDIGKLVVPDAVLGKEGPLTDDEWKIMRLHPATGRRILDGIPFLSDAKEIVYSHHERWDGKGYPRGLQGEEILLGARVFPIADSFDAMTSDRPYRTGMSMEAARREVAMGSGTQFWPEAVEAFLAISEEELDAIRTGSTEWQPHRND